MAAEGGALAHARIRPPPSQGYRHGHEARAAVGNATRQRPMTSVARVGMRWGVSEGRRWAWGAGIEMDGASEKIYGWIERGE
jgi:hypothetical protein